jgi:hypothetical protein
MPKYRVEVLQTVLERCSVEVEADNEAQAKDIAITAALGSTEWKFEDSLGAEVVEITEVQAAENETMS